MMETPRNILSPGETTDDQKQHGSSTSSDLVNSGTSTTTGHTWDLTGEGSHLAKTHNTPRTIDPLHIPGAFDASDTTITGSHTGRDAEISGIGQQTAQHELGTIDIDQFPTSPTYTYEQGADTGLSNTGNTGQDLSNTSNIAGQPIHSFNLTNKGDPIVDDTNTDSTSNVGQGTCHTIGTTDTDTDTQHNLGRDIGVGATGVGVAGLADHGHKKHEGTGAGSGYGSGTTDQLNYGPGTTSNTTGQPGYGSETTSQPDYSSGTSSSTTDQQPMHNSNMLNKVDPRVDSITTGTSTTGSSPVPHDTNTSSGSYTGPEFALGTGATGLAGDSENEQDSFGTTTQCGYSSATPSGQSGPYYSTPIGTAVSGPHSTDTANRFDLHVNKSSGSELEDLLRNSKHHGGGADETDAHHTSRDSHHTSRDAAIGAGTVRLAEHIHHQHEEDTSGVEYPASNTHTIDTGHSSLRDVAVEQQHGTSAGHSGYDNTTHSSSESHLGRDAAIGAGGVGLAENEHEKHDGSHSASAPTSSVGQSAYNQSSRTHQPGTDHQAFPVCPSGISGTTKDHATGTTYDSHKGRDAVGVAGVDALGADAYEADKHHKNDKNDEDSKAAEKEQKELKEERKKEKSEHKEEKKEHKSGGLFSFLHLDKSKKYAPEEEAELDRQEREHNGHAGHDTAAGTAGVGAYEADKHHRAKESSLDNKPLPTTPGNHGVGTGAGPGDALAGEYSQIDASHHYERVAALGAGDVGVGVHEHGNHRGAVPLDKKPPGTCLGDKLCSVDRNRGAQGKRRFIWHSFGSYSP